MAPLSKTLAARDQAESLWDHTKVCHGRDSCSAGLGPAGFWGSQRREAAIFLNWVMTQISHGTYLR